VTLQDIGQWMAEARKKGSVGVVMRVNSVDEVQEVEALPADGTRYQRGNMQVLIFPPIQP
jgi:4-amino-4-deoxy-L-arabinose transferase